MPKPSKFQVGEMYHSDYESDLEGRIPVRWRPSHSDNEDADLNFRRIRPVLKEGKGDTERRPSPPCPHQWESHEDIARMQEQLKLQGGRRLRIADDVCQESCKEHTYQEQLKTENSLTQIEEVRQIQIQEVVKKQVEDKQIQEQRQNTSLNTQREELRLKQEKETKEKQDATDKLKKIEEEGVKVIAGKDAKDIDSLKGDKQARQDEADCIALRLIAGQMIVSQQVIGTTTSQLSSEEPVFYEATATTTNRSTARTVCEENAPPPPLPPKCRGSALSPSPSRGQASPTSCADSASFSDETFTSQSTVRTGQFIRVKEKVLLLERKLEEDALRLEEDEEGEGSGRTSRGGALRPEMIPGAVRLLPTPTPPGSRPASQASSRKSSLSRSNSMEGSGGRAGLFSPLTTCHSLQQSPAFCRRHLETPPPMYRPPDPDILAQSIRMESRRISETFSGPLLSGLQDAAPNPPEVEPAISDAQIESSTIFSQQTKITSNMTKTMFTSSSISTSQNTMEESSPPPRPPPPRYGEIAYKEPHLPAQRSDVQEWPEYEGSATTSRRSTGLTSSFTR